MKRRATTTTTTTTGKPRRKYRKFPARPTPTARVYGRPGFTEVKSFDQVVAIPAVSLPVAAGVAGAEPGVAFTGMTEVNCVPQGATVANRIGNKIVIKSISARMIFQATAGGSSVSFRWMLIYDKQPNGAFPALADILFDQPGAVVTALSSINIANKSRFVMIRDQFDKVDIGTGEMLPVTAYCKGRWETEFGANAGTIADFRTGSLLFLAFVITSPIPAAQMGACQFRIRYFD